MPSFLVAIHLPDGYDAAAFEDADMHRDIDALNDEMVAAGIRAFVCGLRPVTEAMTLEARANGHDQAAPAGAESGEAGSGQIEKIAASAIEVTPGPFLRSDWHMGGFWVLDVADMDAALAWGRKATVACRVPVEVRQLWRPEEAGA